MWLDAKANFPSNHIHTFAYGNLTSTQGGNYLRRAPSYSRSADGPQYCASRRKGETWVPSPPIQFWCFQSRLKQYLIESVTIKTPTAVLWDVSIEFVASKFLLIAFYRSTNYWEMWDRSFEPAHITLIDLFHSLAHQIRVHLQYLGHSICNDSVYSETKIWVCALGSLLFIRLIPS